jgi:hypothetical protein
LLVDELAQLGGGRDQLAPEAVEREFIRPHEVIDRTLRVGVVRRDDSDFLSSFAIRRAPRM